MRLPNLINICTLTATVSLPAFLVTDRYLENCQQNIRNAVPALKLMNDIDYELSDVLKNVSAKEALKKYTTDVAFKDYYNMLMQEYKSLESLPEVRAAQEQINKNYGNPAFSTLLLITGASLIPMLVSLASRREKMKQEDNENPPAAEAAT